jgi:hypothetical protein
MELERDDVLAVLEHGRPTHGRQHGDRSEEHVPDALEVALLEAEPRERPHPLRVLQDRDRPPGLQGSPDLGVDALLDRGPLPHADPPIVVAILVVVVVVAILVASSLRRPLRSAIPGFGRGGRDEADQRPGSESRSRSRSAAVSGSTRVCAFVFVVPVDVDDEDSALALVLARCCCCRLVLSSLFLGVFLRVVVPAECLCLVEQLRANE